MVNVSSAGVLARNPKYSSYLPTKAALDAFSDVVASETLSDHITFTNIHMPLVKTPMIVPSQRLNPVPPINPERAAAMVVRALVEKPARIDTPLGTLAEAGNYLLPKTSRRILHQVYLGYPDSTAALGVSPSEPEGEHTPARRRPRRPVRAVGRIRGPPDSAQSGPAGARSSLVSEPSPVFADVDTGVDDALALIYLLASPDVNLVGIASTGGNVGVQQVCANNLGFLELCRGTSVPVSKGADETLTGPLRTPSKVHGPRGLGYADVPPGSAEPTDYDAATAWVRAARAFPGKLIGVATGPLTNLALALRIEPELPNLLRRLVIMGGSYDHIGNTTAVAEWNISVDPEAAAEVFAAWSYESLGPQGLPILCGLDLTRNVAITPGILVRLADAAGSTSTMMSVDDQRGTRSTASNPMIRVIEDALRFYLEGYYDNGHGYLAHLHDPLAAAVALDPELIATRSGRVDVELAGTLTRGMTVTDWRREPNAHIGIGVDPKAFFDRFIERVGPFAQRLAR